MSRPLRILAGALILAAVLLAGAAAWLLLLFDPNDFKPRLAELASRQGIRLDLRGELSWDLLPRPGIRLGSTGIRADDGRLPEIDFESATLSMTWRSLLRGEPRLEVLELTGAEIRIATPEQAAAAAAAPVAAAPPSATAPAAEAGGVAIGVRSVSVRDTKVVIATARGPRILEGLRLRGRDLRLDGSPFPIELEFTYRDPGLPFPVGVALAAELGVDQRGPAVETRGAHLELTPEGRPALAADLSLRFSGADDLLDISALELRSLGLIARAKGQVTGVRTEPRAAGALELPAADPRPLLAAWQVALPEFGAPDALERVALRTGFSASRETLQLSDLSLEVDATRVTGELQARFAEPRELSARLHGDRLDLGRYRSPPAAPEAAPPEAALLAPLAGPLAFLQGGTGELALDWDELILDQLRLEAIRLRVRFAGGDLRIEELAARTLGGAASVQGRLDGLAGDSPRLELAPRLEGIRLEQVRQTLAPELALDGTLDLAMTGSAQGADADRLHRSLAAEGSFRIADPILAGTNIERIFCDLVASVERTPKRDDWPDLTRFEPIAGSFRLAGPGVTLERLTTAVGNLRLRASGTLDRDTRSYELLAATRLDGDRTSPSGCPVASGRLRGRDIPLRCSGRLGELSGTLCAPDPQFVAGLVEDRVLDELRARGKLEGERGKAVEGLLKGLLKRGRDGD